METRKLPEEKMLKRSFLTAMNTTENYAELCARHGVLYCTEN